MNIIIIIWKKVGVYHEAYSYRYVGIFIICACRLFGVVGGGCGGSE